MTSVHWRGSVPDDRGPGGRHLGAVGRARPRLRGHGFDALFRSDHYRDLDGHPSAGRSTPGRRRGARGQDHDAAAGDARLAATFRHPSVLAKSSRRPTTSPAAASSSAWARAGTSATPAYGFAFPPPRERMDILAEQLEIVPGSWSEERSLRRDHYTLEDLDAQPKPVQRPHPPMIIGGSAGPRSAASPRAGPTSTTRSSRRSTRRASDGRGRQRRGRRPAASRSLLVDDRRARRPGPGELRERAGGWPSETTGGDPERLPEPRRDGSSAPSRRPPRGSARCAMPARQRIMLQHLLHDELDTVGLIGRELPALL